MTASLYITLPPEKGTTLEEQIHTEVEGKNIFERDASAASVFIPLNIIFTNELHRLCTTFQNTHHLEKKK